MVGFAITHSFPSKSLARWTADSTATRSGSSSVSADAWASTSLRPRFPLVSHVFRAFLCADARASVVRTGEYLNLHLVEPASLGWSARSSDLAAQLSLSANSGTRRR